MPRYDLNCLKCQKETIVYVHDTLKVDHSEFQCSHCGHEQLDLVAYYHDEQTQIIALQKELDRMADLIDSLMEKMNMYDSTVKDDGSIIIN